MSDKGKKRKGPGEKQLSLIINCGIAAAVLLALALVAVGIRIYRDNDYSAVLEPEQYSITRLREAAAAEEGTEYVLTVEYNVDGIGYRDSLRLPPGFQGGEEIFSEFQRSGNPEELLGPLYYDPSNPRSLSLSPSVSSGP